MDLRRKILPMPYIAEKTIGRFEFCSDIEVLYNEVFSYADIAVYEKMWAGYAYGLKIKFTKSSAIPEHTICTKGCTTPKDSSYDYVICVEDGGFCLSSSTKEGLIHSFTSLLQLITPKKLTNTETELYILGSLIKDKPMLEMRAVHLCVFPETTLESLEKSITVAGLCKYSHLIIEFWGTLVYDCADYLCWKDYAYTKEQIKPYIDLAHSLGMEVVPMFNHFGHAPMSRRVSGKHVILDNNPRMALLLEPDGWTWCFSNPDTINLLRSIRKELCDLCGQSSYFHLGCDEAYSHATCDICAEKDSIALLRDFLNSVSDELEAEGKKAIMWGDMFLEHNAWEEKYTALSYPEHNTHLILDDLSKNVTIADWHYRIFDSDIKTPEHFMQKGHDVLLCPWENIKNIEALSDCAKRLQIKGAIATTWHTLEQHLYIIPIAAENFWSDFEEEKAEKGYVADRKYENLEVILAKLLRSLFPSGGNYQKSGWHEGQAVTGGLKYE